MACLTNRLIGFVLAGTFTVSSIAFAKDTPDVSVPHSEKNEAQPNRPLVQLAILMDNSGSMEGLIDQARSELWKVVNEFVTAKRGDMRPTLQVALYHYGNPPATQLVPLTDDLDRVSEALFGIPVSGGSEYCGQVIQMAASELQWSESERDLKIIFIAGNEPFTQGPVDYRVACKDAISKGIMINTIHCGTGVPEGWRDGAMIADGTSMNIDHNQAVVHFEAPQDTEIARLGVELNKTYIAFGAYGREGELRQKAQDSNASGVSASSASQRAVAKANVFYRNARWDLCDAFKEGRVDLARIKAEDLPENMRKMTVEQREAYVMKMQHDRTAIQKTINELNAARIKHIAEIQRDSAEQGGTNTLDKALITAIHHQAEKKQLSFGE